MITLNQRLWISFGVLIFAIGFIIAILYPLSIQGTLTDESYKMIKEQQDRMIGISSSNQLLPESDMDFIERRNAERSVGHLAFFPHNRLWDGNPVPSDVLDMMQKNAFQQTNEMEQYELRYQNATLLYLIRRVSVDGDIGYIISYMWDTYRTELIQKLWVRLLWILGITLVISLLLALWLSRYLKRPLKLLGNHFEQISKRNWDTPFHWEGDDEFHQLSKQFERMRQNLIRNDEAQKTFIQHASHELKTPIMTIKSYAQSMKDGILPKKTTEASMDVIIKQASRMEERVKDMLYFAKLDSIGNTTINKEKIILQELIEDVVTRFRYIRDDISLTYNVNDVSLLGDKEQLRILLENLTENAIRYAETQVIVNGWIKEGSIMISVYNDGEQINPEELTELFKPFQKGSIGQFGLGLAIAKRIVELHEGKIWGENVGSGVQFVIAIPI